MKAIDEKRGATRVGTNLEIDLQSGETLIQSAETRDVSLTGLFLACEESLPVGSDCRATLYLDGREGEMRLHARAKVVRCGDGGIAIHFKEISIESFEHLRNLLLYKSEDPDQIEREFDEHVSLKPTG